MTATFDARPVEPAGREGSAVRAKRGSMHPDLALWLALGVGLLVWRGYRSVRAIRVSSRALTARESREELRSLDAR